MLKMIKLITVFIVFCNYFQQISTIRSISDEDYARFPPIRHLDRYNQCVGRPGGVYCSAFADLSPDGSQDLYDLIMNYTKSSERHYNYTNIFYGFCITKRCEKFHKGDSDDQLKEAMGECLNEYFQREYGLKTSINQIYCHRYAEKWYKMDVADWSVLIFLVLLVFLVIFGTAFDLYTAKNARNNFITCFSMVANWKSLTAPWPKDEKSSKLIGLNCMRVITASFVIMAHSLYPIGFLSENTYNLEQVLEDSYLQPLLHLMICMQTFFLFSGFFLAISLENNSEKIRLSWRRLPRAIFLRWLRLTPLYFTMLLITATLMKYNYGGPAWMETVGNEIQDCRKNWPAMALSFNNYVDTQCSLQNWSTAADLHLYILGLSIMFLSPTIGVRNSAIGIMIALGVIVNVFETYMKDLNGALLLSAKLFNIADLMKDPNFIYLYKKTHSNLSCFFMGMAFGLYMNKRLGSPIDTTKHKRYSLLFWLLVPAILAVPYSSSILFLRDGDRGSLTVRMLFATLQKPLWGVLMILLILGLVYKVERVPLMTKVMEWRGWVPLARLTYCTHQIHLHIIKFIEGGSSSLIYLSRLEVIRSSLGNIALSFALGLIPWFLVEAPCANLIRLAFPEKRNIDDKKNLTKITKTQGKTL